MSYSDEIKKIRKKCFLSQEAFGREIGVSFSSINRWAKANRIWLL